MSCADLFLALIAVLFPPIAVWIKSGLCSADSLINILLCCLGYLPGLIHAWYIIARNPEQNYDDYAPIDGGERGERVTYYYVSHQGNPDSQRQYGTQAPQPNKPAVMPPPQPSAGGPSEGEGSQGPAPPSYSDVVKGDNKVQTQD